MSKDLLYDVSIFFFFFFLRIAGWGRGSDMFFSHSLIALDLEKYLNLAEPHVLILVFLNDP